MQRTLFRSVQHTRLAMLAGVVLVLSQTGLASTNTSLSMMETPLQVLQQSLSGPVALAIAVFMPIKRPWLSNSGPPELPGLIAASI